MGRFADPYGDGDRLPEGMICTGYDADEGRRYYADRDGSSWVGAPHADRGVLMPLRTKTTPQEDNAARYGREMYGENVVVVHYSDGTQELALSREVMQKPRKSATCGATPQPNLNEPLTPGLPERLTTEASETATEVQTQCSSPVSAATSRSGQSSSPRALHQTYQSLQLETKESGQAPISETSSSMDSHTIRWPPEGWETHLTPNNPPAQEDGNGEYVDLDFDQDTLRFIFRCEAERQNPSSILSGTEAAPAGTQLSSTSDSKPFLEKEVPELPTDQIHLDEKMDAAVTPKTRLKKTFFASLFTRNRGPGKMP